MRYKSYKKEDNISYTFGAFPTIEMMEQIPEHTVEVLIQSKYAEVDDLMDRCRKYNIPGRIDDRSIARVAYKGNIFVVGVFQKYERPVKDEPHIVLVEPSDMGNMGAIIRTMVGFGYRDLAMIGNGVDVFHPKVIRASMGSFFKIRFSHFDTFDDYLERYSDHHIYPFLLDEERSKEPDEIEKKPLFSLVFGNEGAGLPSHFNSIGDPIRLPQTTDVDSLNLTIAAAIGMYCFREQVKR